MRTHVAIGRLFVGLTKEMARQDRGSVPQLAILSTAIAISLFFESPAFSETTKPQHYFSGYVCDGREQQDQPNPGTTPCNVPLENAEVRLENSMGLHDSTTTDSRGHYTLAPMHLYGSDADRITFGAHGFASSRITNLTWTIDIPPSDSTGATVSLSVEDIAILINMRLLQGEEHNLYVEVTQDIETMLGGRSGEELVRTTEQIVSRIAELPAVVTPATRSALLDDLSRQLAAEAISYKPVFMRLLKADMKDVQVAAIDALQFGTDDWWANDPDTLRELTTILRNATTHRDVQESILGMFFINGSFERVRPIAEILASGKDSRLARTAAFYLCGAMADEDFQSSYVRRLFRSGSGILRQEAALALVRFEHDQMPNKLRNLVIDEIIKMIRDDRLSARTRGKAIEVTDNLLESERVVNTLLEFLSQDEWFFGVPDNHGPAHSLVAVLEALMWSDNPVVLPHVMQLRSQLVNLEEDERWAVESALERAIKRIGKNAS